MTTQEDEFSPDGVELIRNAKWQTDISDGEVWAVFSDGRLRILKPFLSRMCDELERLREEASQLRIENTNLNQRIGELNFDSRTKDSALRSVESIISNSQGVAGWHMNGEIATWGELGLDDEIAEALANEKTTR